MPGRQRPISRAMAPLAVAWLLGSAAGSAVAQPAAQATELLCGMRTGDVTSTLRVAAGSDPLASSSVDVGDRFEVRALALRDPQAKDNSISRVVVTVLDREVVGAPVVLSQSRWSAGGREVLDQHAPWRPTLSGWERVYSPKLGRELAWGCALVREGAAPDGWDRVDATGEADGTPPRQPVAQPKENTAEVRLAWMGDVMLDDGPGRVIARKKDPFHAVMNAMKDADLRIANLECVIATGGQRVAKPWTFRAHPRVLNVLRRHVDVVSLANNHSGDFGPDAFAQMLGRLQQAGLPYFGGGRDLRAAHRPAIIERQGLRIALLGYDEMFPRRFEAGPTTPGMAWADEEQIVAAIRSARTQADIVIPYMHWGQEHSDIAHARQRALARLMIHAGADAVVGTHPHVRQDTEVIDGKPVIYSLGNFVFDGFSDAENNTGSILWMTVTAAGVKDWHLQAVHIDRSGQPQPEEPVPTGRRPSGRLR